MSITPSIDAFSNCPREDLVISIPFCWVYHSNLSDWPLIFSSTGLEFNVSDSAILSGIDTDYSTNIPVSSNCTWSLHDHEVIYSNVPFLCIPLFSW